MALINASRDGDIETVRRLLEEGADVDYADRSSKTALIYASECGHTDIVVLLVQYMKSKSTRFNYF